MEELDKKLEKEYKGYKKDDEKMSFFLEMMAEMTGDKIFTLQLKKKEEEITTKEKEAVELRNKYFGQDGEMTKKRQSLLKPIQEDVYNAVKKVSEEKGYQVIFDRASSTSIVFASPRIDVSNEVLTKLGYSK